MVIPPILAAKGAQSASKALTGDIYVRRWTTTAKKGKRKGMPVEHEVRVNAVTAAVAAVGVGLAALAGGAALWMTQQKLGKTGEKKALIRWVRVYDPKITMVTIVDKEAWTETFQIPQSEEGHYETAPTATVICPVDGNSINMAASTEQEYSRWEQLHRLHWSGDWQYASGQVWVIDVPAGWQTVTVDHPAETHEEARYSDPRTVIMTQRGIPIKTYAGLRVSFEDILGPRLSAQYGYNSMVIQGRPGEDRLGTYREWVIKFAHLSKESIGLQERTGFTGGGIL